MNVLLTGGSGFLGSALALHLRESGFRIALLLRPASRLDRLHGTENSFDLGRCASDEEIDRFVSKVRPDVIIHTACAYGRNGETLTQLSDANLRFGLNILQSALRTERPVTFINTGTVLEANVSSYALTKHQFAKWGLFLANQPSYHLRFINVLLQHIYGPGDDPSKFTTHVINTCYKNLSDLKLTQGEQTRDFLYIEDVTSAYHTLLTQSDQLENAVEIEVGSGEAPTIREFVQTVHRLTTSHIDLKFGDLSYRPNEPMHCVANLEQMKSLGWTPKYSLEEGLKRTIELEFCK